MAVGKSSLQSVKLSSITLSCHEDFKIVFKELLQGLHDYVMREGNIKIYVKQLLHHLLSLDRRGSGNPRCCTNFLRTALPRSALPPKIYQQASSFTL